MVTVLADLARTVRSRRSPDRWRCATGCWLGGGMFVLVFALAGVVEEPRRDLPVVPATTRHEVRRTRALVQIPRFDVLEVRDVLLGQNLGEQRSAGEPPTRPADRRAPAPAFSFVSAVALSPVAAAASAQMSKSSLAVTSGCVVIRREQRVVQVRLVGVEILSRAADRCATSAARRTADPASDIRAAARRRTDTRSSARWRCPRRRR